MPLRRAVIPVALLLIVGAAAEPLEAQRLVWRNEFTFYGDNTEFFTPFREGETLLGAQFESFLRFKTSTHTEVLAGVFGDQRSGSDEFLDPVKPLLSFRYRTEHSLGVLGTLETVDRHGFLEPLQVTTLEITRPVEYGLQWVERREHLDAEAFINWQVLNTPESREIFDYGLIVRVRPLEYLTLEYQGHGKHRGGQLFSAGVQVTNNFAGGPGVRLTAPLPVVREGSLALFQLWSNGIFATDPPPGRPAKGHGTYVRASVSPSVGELFAIFWFGRDFLSEEGDNNYNSVGRDPGFYRSKRRYTEIGFRRELTIDHAVSFRVEARFHKVDGYRSSAISGTDWEYSYRVMVRAPFELAVLGDR